MIREVDLVSYLPPFLQEYKEQNNALTAENPEFTIVWNAADRVLYNEFISTADEYGIARYEKILGILPFAEDTLESRRARVQLRWFNSIPYTMKSLLAKLVALCGENHFTITKQFSVYQMYVDTNLELFGQVEELERSLQTMMPCNIVVISQNSIPCSAQGTVLFGGGIVQTDSFLITNDSNETHAVNGVVNFGGGIVETTKIQVTQDFNETMKISGDVNAAAGVVHVEFIEINS